MFESLLSFLVLSFRELSSEFTTAAGEISVLQIKCRTELCTPALNKSKDSDLGVCGGEEENDF